MGTLVFNKAYTLKPTYIKTLRDYGTDVQIIYIKNPTWVHTRRILLKNAYPSVPIKLLH